MSTFPFALPSGVIASALIQLRCEFMLTDLAKEWVVTSMLVGALVASLTGGKRLYIALCSPVDELTDGLS